MPKKKKDKVATSRPRAKMPDGDEGKDLEADIKQAKLETLLKDFDDTVEQRLAEIRNYGKTIIREMKTFHQVEVMKIPKNITDMKLKDFLAIGGTVSKVKMMENKQIEDQMEAIVDSKKGQRLMKKATHTEPLESIAEEGQENVGPAESAKTRTRGEPTTVMNPLLNAPSKTRNGASRKKPLTAVTRNRAAVAFESGDMATPMNKKPSQSGWETPLVTPKFDPRLPFTPATMRRKKPGESITSVHMSLAGSPVAADKLELSVPLKTGNVLCLAADDDPANIPLEHLGEDTMENLARFHKMLSDMISKHKNQ